MRLRDSLLHSKQRVPLSWRGWCRLTLVVRSPQRRSKRWTLGRSQSARLRMDCMSVRWRLCLGDASTWTMLGMPCTA